MPESSVQVSYTAVMSSVTKTVYSIGKEEKRKEETPPPVPPRDPPKISRSNTDGTASKKDKVPQGHDILQEAERKRALEYQAAAAAVGYTSQQPLARPQNSTPQQGTQPNAPVQPQQILQDSLRRPRSDSNGGVSTGWNPLGFLSSKSSAANSGAKDNTSANASTSAMTNSSRRSDSPGMNNTQFVYELQKHSYREVIQHCVHYKDRAIFWRDKVTQLENELESFKTVNASLQHHITDQDSAVRKAQESAFAVVASSAPKALDDDVIRSKLRSIADQWKPFAKRWALKSLAELRGERFDLAKSMLEKHLADDEHHSPDGLFEQHNASKAPGILLNAELARFVVKRFIQNPFIAAYQFGAKNDGDDPKRDTSRVLTELYGYMEQDDPPAAHNWRSQTVSTIDPPEHGGRGTSRQMKEDAARRKDIFYRELITEFETSRVRALFRDCSEDEIVERRLQLAEIFRESGDLFSTLWAQKVQISYRGRRDFLKQPFSVQSREFEAHAAHKLEEGDQELDGKSIQLVVEPAVIAWGNEYGEGYDQYKVWMKAVVWVSTPGARRTQG